MNSEHIPAPRLSICIATRNRGDLLPHTLDSLRDQLNQDVELVFVDGGSTDNTGDVVAAYRQNGASVQYHFHDDNAGLDRDYDRAVAYAKGEYCWLLTDDDIVAPGAVQHIFSELGDGINLLVLNTRVLTRDLSKQLQPSRMPEQGADHYSSSANNEFLTCFGDTLSFIGSVVIRRQEWIGREREAFFGSMFIHYAVIFQAPGLAGVKVIRTPLIALRYGNASWTTRTFEIWTVLWPKLVWSLGHYSGDARSAVTREHPWRSPLYLCKQRARGAYGMLEYERFIAGRPEGPRRFLARLIALIPGKLLNLVATVYVLLPGEGGRLGLYDLRNSPFSSPLAKLLARLRGL